MQMVVRKSLMLFILFVILARINYAKLSLSIVAPSR
jgi:hypothetical protein